MTRVDSLLTSLPPSPPQTESHVTPVSWLTGLTEDRHFESVRILDPGPQNINRIGGSSGNGRVVDSAGEHESRRSSTVKRGLPRRPTRSRSDCSTFCATTPLVHRAHWMTDMSTQWDARFSLVKIKSYSGLVW